MHKRIKITLMNYGLIIESEVEEEVLVVALKLAITMIERKNQSDNEVQPKPQTNGDHNEVH